MKVASISRIKINLLGLALVGTPKLLSVCGTLLAWALSAATSAANASIVSKLEATEESWWVMGSKEGLV